MVKGGPVAVVTGASRGLGKQVAIELAAKGYHLLLGARDAERLAATTAEIDKSGGTAAFKAFNQTDPSSVEEFADWVKKAAAKIDALVNCAGVALEDNGDTSVLEARSEDVIGTIESNLFGPWRLCTGARRARGEKRAHRERVLRNGRADRHGRRLLRVPGFEGGPQRPDAYPRP